MFIVVLGIVVDDAIVVGENIHIFRKRGLKGPDAALEGAYQVAKPVIFAVLTTMVTFSPMILVEGALGKVWRIIPVVTIVVLIFFAYRITHHTSSTLGSFEGGFTH